MPNTSDGFGSGCGTSMSAPLVGGAAGLLLDWGLDQVGPTFKNPGTLYTWMLGMTDRATSDTTYRTSGFSPQWGGGRFQLRYFGNDGAPGDDSGNWGYEHTIYVLTNGAADIANTLNGSGAEPAGIDQAKFYMMTGEVDNGDVSDILLSMKAGNCAGSTIRSDFSFDVKKMVRGSAAEVGGQALCALIRPIYIPSGYRIVNLWMYYSDETDFR